MQNKIIYIILIENFWVSFFCLLAFYANSQLRIFGKITDVVDEPIPFCQVTVKTSADSSEIISFSFTDTNGEYSLQTDSNQKLFVQFSINYYYSHSEILTFEDGETSKELNVSLKPNPQKLDDVILEGTQAVIVKKDTVIYRAQEFRRGDEQVLEDLLENIPGIEVSSEGTIRVEGKEIEKIMIEGSDLVGEDYKLLSKNMPDYPIEEVELFRNYQENHLLRGVYETGDFALNLKLDKQFKNVWFANVKSKSDFGIDSKYQFAGNLFGIFKKTQSFVNTQLNSIGELSSINNFTLSYFHTDTRQEIERLGQLITIGTFRPRFGNANFNNQESVSLNTVFKPTENMETRLQMLFHWDEVSLLRTINREVGIGEINFENKEKYNLKRKPKGWASSARLKYEMSKNQLLEYRGSYNSNQNSDAMSFDFNELTSSESLSLQEQFVSQNIDYTLALTRQKVLQVNLLYAHENRLQDYTTNQNFFGDFFEDPSGNQLEQSIQNKLNLGKASIIYTQKVSTDNLWKFGIHTKYRKESLDTPFRQGLDFNEFQFVNGNSYSIWELAAYISRQFGFKKLKDIPQLDFSSTTTSLIASEKKLQKTKNYLLGSIQLKWTFSQKHYILMGYVYSIDPMNDLVDLTPDYFLVNRNSLQKGTGMLDFLTQSNYRLSYQNGKPSRRISFTTGILHNVQHDFLTSNQTITQNYEIDEMVLVKDQTFTTFSSIFDYYLRNLFTNIKLKLSYSFSDFYFFLQSNKNTFKSSAYGIGLEVRTAAFDHLDVIIGNRFRTPKVSINGIDRPTVYSTSQFLDLIFKLNKNITLKTVIDRSAYKTFENQQDFWLVNFYYDHILIKNKLNFGIELTNLLNEDSFTTVSAGNLGTTTSEYRLQPLIGLVKLEYRF
ncbi:MAG: hypothetical protein OXC03_02085 [Flavobacteriaceae bacterium]|nr:hypothetical protein [Flavobacteriaceae bacterium]